MLFKGIDREGMTLQEGGYFKPLPTASDPATASIWRRSSPSRALNLV
jgi:hypothetical protein